MGKMFQMLGPISCCLFKRKNFCWGVHLFFYGVSTLIFQFGLISFKLCFSLFLFYFVVLFCLGMGHKRGRKTGKGNGKSPPKKKYQTKKKAYTKQYVPLKEDPQAQRSRGASHKEKDLNNWPEQNMLPGTFMFWSLLLLFLLLVSFAASPVAALCFALMSQHTSCRPLLMPSHSL